MTDHAIIWAAMGLWIYEAAGLITMRRATGDAWPYHGVDFGLCMTDGDGDLIVCALMNWAVSAGDYEAFEELERKWYN